MIPVSGLPRTCFQRVVSCHDKECGTHERSVEYEDRTTMNVLAVLTKFHGVMANPTMATMKGPRRVSTNLGISVARSIPPVTALPAI